jgi:hypothetical protein
MTISSRVWLPVWSCSRAYGHNATSETSQRENSEFPVVHAGGIWAPFKHQAISFKASFFSRKPTYLTCHDDNYLNIYLTPQFSKLGLMKYLIFYARKPFAFVINWASELGKQVLFWQKIAAAIIYPPGDKQQIPSSTAGNTLVWLCKHIKEIKTKGEGGSHAGHPGYSALGMSSPAGNCLRTKGSVLARKTIFISPSISREPSLPMCPFT